MVITCGGSAILLSYLGSVSLRGSVKKQLRIVIMSGCIGSFLNSVVGALRCGCRLLCFGGRSGVNFNTTGGVKISLTSSSVVLFLGPSAVLVRPIFKSIYRGVVDSEHVICKFALVSEFGRMGGSCSVFFRRCCLLPIIGLYGGVSFCFPGGLGYFGGVI